MIIEYPISEDYVLETTTKYRIIAVIDERTHDLCLADNGKEFSVIEVAEKLPHVDLGDPEFRCRCVLEPIEWEGE